MHVSTFLFAGLYYLGCEQNHAHGSPTSIAGALLLNIDCPSTACLFYNLQQLSCVCSKHTHAANEWARFLTPLGVGELYVSCDVWTNSCIMTLERFDIFIEFSSALNSMGIQGEVDLSEGERALPNE